MEQITLRDYQEQTVKDTVGYYTNGYSSILIESPTGSGKTIMGLSALKRFKEGFPKVKIAWVAMRRTLLAQAAQENERVGLKDIEFVSMFARNPPKADLIVTDEAQHDSSNTCATLHERMGVKRALGLTATPFRTDRIKLCYEKVINNFGVRYLIEKGWLSSFRQFMIPQWTPQNVSNLYLREPERWGKSVFYFHTMEECLEHDANLKAAGIRSAVVSCEMSHTQQDQVFEDFEQGRITCLTNINLLTEGFNAPDMGTVWVRDSGKLCTIQMAGRVLRLDPKNPRKVANIVQSEKTRFPYTRITKPREQYVWQEGQWLSLNSNDLVDTVAMAVRDRVLTLPVSLPAFLARGKGAKVAVDGKVVASKKKKGQQPPQNLANQFE
jgi:superfamily II DNA or RNA helicase